MRGCRRSKKRRGTRARLEGQEIKNKVNTKKL